VDPGARGTTKFYARRFAHETVIHRADAILAVGAEFTLDEEVALDAIDEWMELGSLPMHFEIRPWMRELLGPGRTLHFHATDTAPEAAAEWLIDLTGDAIVWRREHEKGRSRRAWPADRSINFRDVAVAVSLQARTGHRVMHR